MYDNVYFLVYFFIILLHVFHEQFISIRQVINLTPSPLKGLKVTAFTKLLTCVVFQQTQSKQIILSFNLMVNIIYKFELLMITNTI